MSDRPPRVLVVDDDHDIALLISTVLQRRAGCVVDIAHDGFRALDAVRTARPDVVVTDIQMPGLTGLELLERLGELIPTVPVIVMTAHASVDYAVAALRANADEFISKPMSNEILVETVLRVAAEGRRRLAARARHDVVLAIGAHPDDVEIGVGGILAAHAYAGDDITILTMSRGGRGGDSKDRQHESLAAAEMLGARLFLQDLADTEVPGGGPTVRLIEEVVREARPDIVYTHSPHDRHQDHRAVSEATVVATRQVATVACYQSPSATVDYRPTRFVRIDGFLERKLELLECFRSQAAARRDYLEPDAIVATARYWSRFSGSARAVEPLEIVRQSTELVRVEEKVQVEEKAREES